MTFLWLLSWWNLIFVAPFGLALLYLGMYTGSGITFGDVDHDFDVDHDIDVDHDAELSADADHDGDVEADHDADQDSAGEMPGGSPITAALQWLGVGRVPLSILLMVMLLAWGWTGVVSNFLLAGHMASGWRVIFISVPLALGISIFLTRVLAGAIARWFPLCDTTARRRHELLGCIGPATFAIDERFGMAAIRDTTGDLYQVPCHVSTGQSAIPKGTHVKLIAYSGKQGIFTVVPWPQNVGMKNEKCEMKNVG